MVLKLGKTKAVDEITLLVLERGAEWPSWGAGLRTRAAHSAVEVQGEGESIEEFQARVSSTIQKLKARGAHLVAAGYACSLDGKKNHSSRAELGAELLQNLHDAEGVELIVAGGGWETSGPEGAERERLITLWGELSQLQGSAQVSIRFDQPKSESGSYRAVPRIATSMPSLG